MSPLFSNYPSDAFNLSLEGSLSPGNQYFTRPVLGKYRGISIIGNFGSWGTLGHIGGGFGTLGELNPIWVLSINFQRHWGHLSQGYNHILLH